jgi:regulator of replication initiation timing
MDPYSDPMDKDLAALEQRVSSLIAHTRALRAANESLRRDLADAHQRQRDLTERMQQATDRVDLLLARIGAE